MQPLYFYHVVDKTSNLTKGLLSLKYLYDHKMYDLFDKYNEKYKTRIVKDWNIPKYQNKDIRTLTREEILDALTIFRGINGPSYIYFFRYPLYEELGLKIKELLKVKDIYRIDINNPKTKKYIKEIFYGYENSNSDNKKLTKKYYETITPKKYFKNYNDNASLNFASLNHIAISFKDNYCPLELLEKIN